MSGELITKEELQVMIDIQSKNVQQLTTIANQLSIIVEKENKIQDRLFNGFVKDIAEAVGESTAKCIKDSLPNMLKVEIENSKVSRDMEYTKWFIGIVGTVIVVALVVLRGLDNRWIDMGAGKALQKVEQRLDAQLMQIEKRGESK
jgi:hypothetical protein